MQPSAADEVGVAAAARLVGVDLAPYQVAGVVTLAGSKINAGNAPAASDALLVERLRPATCR